MKDRWFNKLQYLMLLRIILFRPEKSLFFGDFGVLANTPEEHFMMKAPFKGI